MITIKVIQYLKDDIKDPEGTEVKRALVRLGYPVERVSMGREFLVDIDVDTESEALDLCGEMTERFLINPIPHDYKLLVMGSKVYIG